MIMLDIVFLAIAALFVVIAIVLGRGIGLALIILISYLVNEVAIRTLNIETFIDFYITGADWMLMIIAVDLAVIGILAYRAKRSELWLILAFGASAIFHAFCRLEFIGHDADLMPLYDNRFEFIKFIAALQLGGVLLNITGGSFGGGKLVKLWDYRRHSIGSSIHNHAAYKAKK